MKYAGRESAESTRCSHTGCTECWSQGRAKLRAFPHHLAQENTQLSPSLTPTLGIGIKVTLYK